MDFEFCKAEDTVVEIRAHVDDMTGEHLTVAMEQLMAAGALDVAAMPILMKKGRAGFLLTVMTRPKEAEQLGNLILQVTTTSGVRFSVCPRLVKSVNFKEITWSGETVRIKKMGTGEFAVYKPEAEDLSRLAQKTGLSFAFLSEAVLAEVGRF